MTWKAGDTVSLPIYMESMSGVPVVYATAAAFTAAGGALIWYNGSVALSSQPSYTLVPIAATGWHTITFVLPSGVTHVLPTMPTYYRSDPADLPLVVPVNDSDALFALFNVSIGTPVLQSPQSTYNFSFPEGDSVQQPFSIPTSALRILDASGKFVYQYTDLSDIGGQPWTIAAQARYTDSGGPLPFNPVAFSFSAVITSKVSPCAAAIGWLTPPAGAIIDSFGAAATATQSGGIIQSTVTVTNGGVYYAVAPVVTITGAGGGTGCTATATVVNGSVTAVTVTAGGTGYSGAITVSFSTVGDQSILARQFYFDLQLQPPSGSTYVGAKLTPVTGLFTLTRQWTTTP